MSRETFSQDPEDYEPTPIPDEWYDEGAYDAQWAEEKLQEQE